MEGYLRLALLFIAGVIVFLIMFEAWHRRRRLKTIKSYLDFDSAPVLNTKGYANQNYNMVDQPAAIEPPAPRPLVQEAAPVIQFPNNSLLVVSVIARPDSFFSSYELLQAIAATGMRFGEMNIFHYYSQTPGKKTPLFSLASATEPGEFDLNNMGEYSCNGLTLFMDAAKVPNPEQVLNLMISAAEQLADDLDGELRAGQRTPWNDTLADLYRQKAQQAQVHASAV